MKIIEFCSVPLKQTHQVYFLLVWLIGQFGVKWKHVVHCLRGCSLFFFESTCGKKKMKKIHDIIKRFLFTMKLQIFSLFSVRNLLGKNEGWVHMLRYSIYVPQIVNSHYYDPILVQRSHLLPVPALFSCSFFPHFSLSAVWSTVFPNILDI